jgi:prepilin-type N-terminal cleavage/methylation domain-containing protein
MRRQQSGFTLVEIAIVLVIIGLLLGGVLKGQELINSAKVKNFATDFRNIPLFIYGYQDKFKALPGDDGGADAHIGGNCATTTCQVPAGTANLNNGRLDGNWWDGHNGAAAPNSETFMFWRQVREANLAAGPSSTTDPQYIPRNADGGLIGIQSGSPAYITGMTGTYVVCSSGILGKFAKQLDVNMDDGQPFTGSIRAVKGKPTANGNTASCVKNADGSTPVGCTDVITDSDSYTVCMAF